MEKVVSLLAQATCTGAKTVRIVENRIQEVNRSLKFNRGDVVGVIGLKEVGRSCRWEK